MRVRILAAEDGKCGNFSLMRSCENHGWVMDLTIPLALTLRWLMNILYGGMKIFSRHTIFSLTFLSGSGCLLVCCLAWPFLIFFIKKFWQSLREVRIQIPLLLCIPLLVHSLLEYPLHYFYFLLIFAVFVGKLMVMDGKHCTEIKTERTIYCW